MKKTKVNDIVLKINVAERHKAVKKALPPQTFRLLETVLKRSVREAKEHFKKDGWDLSYRCLEADVYGCVFGPDLEYYILGRFLEAGDWHWKKSKWGGTEDYLCKRDPIKKSKRGKK